MNRPDQPVDVELASDFLTAGYYLVVDGEPIRPENGVGTWATRAEALEAWDEIARSAQPIRPDHN